MNRRTVILGITLAMTALRRITGWNAAVRYRRMPGLFAFFYGSLHLLTYLIADRLAGLDFPAGLVAWQTVNASRARLCLMSSSGRSSPWALVRGCACYC